MSGFVSVTKGQDPSKANGLKRAALVTALRELGGGGWHDRAGVEQAMAEASLRAVRTCRNDLREWTNYGLLATDTGYTAGRAQVRPPRVALTDLGYAWASEKGLVKAPVCESVMRKPRSQGTSGRVSDKGAGQTGRLGVLLTEAAVSRPPSPGGSVGRSPSDGVLSLNGHTQPPDPDTLAFCGGCLKPWERVPRSGACLSCGRELTVSPREVAVRTLESERAKRAEEYAREREDRRRRMAAQASTFRSLERQPSTPVS